MTARDIFKKSSESLRSSSQLQSSEAVYVRWFYRESDDKRWIPFNGFDSLNLEAKYGERCFDQVSVRSLSSWPHGLQNADVISLASSRTQTSNLGTWIPVMSGLFDVDLRTLTCHPVYWKSPKHPIRVLRGVWFKDLGNGLYDPLENDAMLAKIESEYQKCFSTQPLIHEEPVPITPAKVARIPSLPTTASAPSLLNAFVTSVEANKENAGSSGGVKKKPVIRTVKFTDCHVDFHGPNEIYFYQDSASMYIRQKLGMPKVGTRLRRGYKEAARLDDKPPDVTHLCFVVHGIGQKMGFSITKCVTEFREACNKLQAKYFSAPEFRGKRVEFLPVEWRSSLQLDGDTVESITPTHVRGLRTTLNSSAMDILYYTSPLYRTEIITSLLSELNRLYSMFSSRNPGFVSNGGKVSVIGHSLGCVLIYDLITGWNQPVQGFQKSPASNELSGPSDESTDSIESPEAGETRQSRERESSSAIATDSRNKRDSNSQKLQQIGRLHSQLEAAKTEVHRLEQELALLANDDSCPTSPSTRSLSTGQSPESSKRIASASSHFSSSSLLFKDNLQNLFCLGSPLAVFLVLRGVRPGGDTTQDGILPRRLCPRIFNIYHPADPVAYRLEPLILKHYMAIQPALIHRADSAGKPDYDDMPLITISGKEIERQPVGSSSEESTSSSETAQTTNHHRNYSSNQQQQQTSFDTPSSSSSDSHRSSLTNIVLGLFRSSNQTETANLLDRATASDGSSFDNAASNQSPSDPEDETLQQESSRPTVPLDSSESNQFLAANLPDDAVLVDEPIPISEAMDFSLQLERRLDYEIRASRYEQLYLSILTSHTCYWSNADVCMLILTHLLQAHSR